MNNNSLLPKLSQNLLEILNEEEYYDITIEVEHIKLPEILPEIFQIILRYIYGGRLPLEEYDISDIIKILDAANKLSLQELINYLQFYLIEKKAKWIEQNFVLIYQSSFENNSFLELQKYYKVLPYEQILPKDLYKGLMKSFLSLLDPNSKLKKPHVTKEINLRITDSKIITYQHAELILKWIGKLEITDELTSSYELRLLFRGSRDGLAPDKFHKICDGHSCTITVVKVIDSNEILGGYNPIAWKSDYSYSATKDSFIFSFENSNHVLSRVINERYAIYNNLFGGPSFGGGDLDLLRFTSRSEILPEIFEIILRYIYGGKVSLEEFDISAIIKILDAASKLSLQELINYLQSYLIKIKANWIEQNFNMVYQASFENNSFLELQKYCTKLISDEPDKIFQSLNFSSIPEKLLALIIQNDNLQMSEVQIWEHVLKWGFAQNPELSSDPTSFSGESAIYNDSKFGPSFGGGDLYLLNSSTKSGNSICVKYSYDKSIRKTANSFSIEELEVFQIIKN
ncbi:BTB/POZ protein [Rhizophagus irregularis DAOM 181602=DAOM 197198]|nr:BTB/POZ protein [Rhizophagus irregularis DAOM 181602=DAOM 197198]